MTKPNPADVTQEDRIWAHYMLLAANKVHPTHESAILAGEWDGTDEVRFIVRHRIAALQQSRSAVEALKRIVERCEEFENINLVGRSIKAKEAGTLRRVLQDARCALSQESADGST